MGEFGGLIGDIMLAAKANGWFWPLVIVGVAVFVLLLWLIFRDARLWYWKVDKQVGTLKSIDEKLRSIEQGLAGRAEVEAAQEKEPLHDAQTTENGERQAPKKESSCRGKSGRIYTEVELEALIRE